MQKLFIFLLLIVQLVIVVKLQYPPSFEQVSLGILSPRALWTVRIFSLLAIAASVWIFAQISSLRNKWIFYLLHCISPALLIVWMSHPLDSLKLLAISLVILLGFKKVVSLRIAFTIGVLIILIINIGLLRQSPSGISNFSLTKSQLEVTARFSTEDSIDPNVDFPLIFRRIAYNKYAILLNNTGKQVMGFFDTESLFFEEVHPLDSKSQILLYWPSFVLFVTAVWLAAQKKIHLNNQFFLLLALSFVNYLFSNDSTHKRILLNLPLVIWICALGFEYLWGAKQKIIRAGLTTIIFTSLYGLATFLLYLNSSPHTWLDNKPYVYKQLLTSDVTSQINKYDQVFLTDVLGQAAKYCQYYVKDCSNFTFTNFDLSKDAIQPNSLYMGFVGNIYGSHLSNFPVEHSGISEIISNAKTIESIPLNDNVANKYGKQLLIIETKP